MQKKLISGLILLALFQTFSFAKTGRQAILQSGDQPIVIALGDIPTPIEYQPAIDQYMQNVSTRLQSVENELVQLSASLEKNDLAQAQQHYIQAHYQYETIRPIILVFGNIDRMINSRADAYLEREQSPNFKGFHAVEYQLFNQQDPSKALIANQQLLKYVKDLNKRVAIETIPLAKMAQSAPDFAEHILENKLSGKDNIYSEADLGEIMANLEGIELALAQLTPHLSADYLKDVQDNLIAIQTVLQTYQQDNNYQPYSALSDSDKHQLYGQTSQLAELLAQMRSQLKIEVYHNFETAIFVEEGQ